MQAITRGSRPFPTPVRRAGVVPPIGTTLFITSTIAKVRMGDVVKELIPFYAVAIGLLLGFAYLPWLTIR